MRKCTEKKFNILVINPGSTSTKLALFTNKKLIKRTEINHSFSELKNFKKTADQFGFRFNKITDWVENNFDINKINAVIGRGGLLKPMKSGVYGINGRILQDLKKAKYGEHASNLGAIIAHKFARKLNIPSFTVDPVTVDEMSTEARLTGLLQIKRISVFHALNQKAAARRYAEKIKKPYKKLNLIVAHLGGGITIGAHKAGKVIDVNNGLEEGPFSPERAGTLPVQQLIKLCYSGKYTKEEMLKNAAGKGGFVSLLNTNNCREIEKKIKKGNKYYLLIYRAMAYNIVKLIGAMSAVLNGDVDAVIITGSLAKSRMLISYIRPKIKFIGPVVVYPGEDEMKALLEGGLRVLFKEEKPLKY